MLDSLIVEYYRNAFLQIKRGVIKGGKLINAKPIMLITIIDSIEGGLIKDNKIYMDKIKDVFDNTYKKYVQEMLPTPIHKPFYHLYKDGFWNLKWNSAPSQIKTISAKFIRDNIEYAYLDNALWDLLQDEKIRQDYKTTIENFFLK